MLAAAIGTVAVLSVTAVIGIIIGMIFLILINEI